MIFTDFTNRCSSLPLMVFIKSCFKTYGGTGEESVINQSLQVHYPLAELYCMACFPLGLTLLAGKTRTIQKCLVILLL